MFSRRNRIFVGILLAYALGVATLMFRLVGDIDPRYRESAEESLVETAYLMADWVAALPPGPPEAPLDAEALAPVFRALYTRRFEAKIFDFTKTRVELRAVVTDPGGRVIFDSLGRHVGENHAKWRDIRLAMEGRYGARTSRDVEGKPDTSVMYVAAPVWRDGRLVGIVEVGKPVESFGQFVEAARRKTMLVGLTSVAAVILLVLILSVWLVRPFGLVSDYVRFVRQQRSFSLPRLSRRAWGVIGQAYQEMRDALAGRNYVADYVQTLTHEVKSPLSAIRGAAELLQEPSMPAADRERFAANIQRETERIQELIDRMLELTALEAQRGLSRVEPVDLRTVVRDLAASAQASAAARRIRVRVDDAGTAAGQSALVDGDPLLLRRALSNLIDNAIDFSPDEGTVTLDVQVQPRSVTVTVTDQGPGLPEFAEDKVFEKFYSLPRPHNHKRSTGLGLPFVKEVAELHLGRASLRNGETGGCVATLSLSRTAARRT